MNWIRRQDIEKYIKKYTKYIKKDIVEKDVIEIRVVKRGVVVKNVTKKHY